MSRRLITAAIITAAVSTGGSLGAPQAALAGSTSAESAQVDCSALGFRLGAICQSVVDTVNEETDCSRFGFRIGAICQNVKNQLPASTGAE